MNSPEIINAAQASSFDDEYYNIDSRMGRDSGLASGLLVNNELFKEMSKDNWSMSDWTSDVTKMTHGRIDGKFFQTVEQTNEKEIAEWCQRYRQISEVVYGRTFDSLSEVEKTYLDPLCGFGEDGFPTFRNFRIPKVVARQISLDYFGNTPYEIIKKDKTMWYQFCQIIEQDYPVYVCHPTGKMPLKERPRIPNKANGPKTFYAGHGFTLPEKTV